MDAPLVEDLPLPEGPLSPWLRLAHVCTYSRQASGAPARLRVLRDFELILVLEGNAWLWCEAQGGALAMPAGTVALLPPGLAHAHAQEGHSHLAVHFDLVADPSLKHPAMIIYAGGLRGPDPPLRTAPRCRLGGTDGLIWRLVTPVTDPGQWRERLGRLVHHYRLGRHQALDARLEAAEQLTWALRRLSAGGNASPCADPRIVAAMEAVEAEPTRPWTVAALARRCDLGPTAFRSAFRTATGTTPRRWLEGRRCELAARLLVESARPVAEVARACGFADPFHFSRVFRRAMGDAPSAFRLSAGMARA